MRFFRALFTFIFFLVFLFVLGFYALIQMDGKHYAEQYLSRAFRREVVIGRVGMLLPFGVRFDNLRIEDALNARTVEAQLHLPFIVGRHIVISDVRLIGPQFVVYRGADRRMVWGVIEGAGTGTPAGERAADAAAPVPVRPPVRPIEGINISNLEVIEGRVVFMDLSAGLPRRVTLEDITLRAHDIFYPPRDQQTYFQAEAEFRSTQFPFSGSRGEARGWVNVARRGLETKLRVFEPDGVVGIEAALNAEANDLEVKGKIDAGRLAGSRAVRLTENPDAGALVKAALQATGVEVMLDFSFRTKLDDFRIENLHVPFSGLIVHKGTPLDGKTPVRIDLQEMGERLGALGKNLTRAEPAGAVPGPPAAEPVPPTVTAIPDMTMPAGSVDIPLEETPMIEAPEATPQPPAVPGPEETVGVEVEPEPAGTQTAPRESAPKSAMPDATPPESGPDEVEPGPPADAQPDLPPEAALPEMTAPPLPAGGPQVLYPLGVQEIKAAPPDASPETSAPTEESGPEKAAPASPAETPSEGPEIQYPL